MNPVAVGLLCLTAAIAGCGAATWLMRAMVIDARRTRAHTAAALREVVYELSRLPCEDEECDGPAEALNPDTCDRCTAIARAHERLHEPVPPLCSVCKAGPVVRWTDAGDFCEAHRLHRSPGIG